MIKFEFTVDDIDAANLIAILRDEADRSRARAEDYEARVRERNGDHPTAEANARWYRAHTTYLEHLTEKVLKGNSRVK